MVGTRARPSMADPPEHRVGASRQQHVTVSASGMNTDLIPRRNQERFLDCPQNSDAADEFFSEASVHSMTEEELEEDDLLDDEEEYLKEMEDQRLSDVKNGHFEEDRHPPTLTTASVEQVVACISHSSAAAPLYQDRPLGENPGLEQVQHHGNVGLGGDASLIHGEVGCVAEVMEQSVFEKSMADGTSMHASMWSGQTLHAKPTYPSIGSTENQVDIPYFMEKKQQLSAGYGQVDVEEFMLPAPAVNRSLDHQEANQYDLMEARSLVVQSLKTGFDGGPPIQVTSILDHSFFPSPSTINSQPNPFQLSPSPLLNQISHSPKNILTLIPSPLHILIIPSPKNSRLLLPHSPKSSKPKINMQPFLKKIINPLVHSSQILTPGNNSPSRFLPVKNTQANPKAFHPHILNPSLFSPAQTWRIFLRSAAPIRLQQLRRLPRPIGQPLLMLFYLRLLTTHPRLLFLPRMLILHLFLGLI